MSGTYHSNKSVSSSTPHNTMPSTPSMSMSTHSQELSNDENESLSIFQDEFDSIQHFYRKWLQGGNPDLAYWETFSRGLVSIGRSIGNLVKRNGDGSEENSTRKSTDNSLDTSLLEEQDIHDLWENLQNDEGLVDANVVAELKRRFEELEMQIATATDHPSTQLERDLELAIELTNMIDPVDDTLYNEQSRSNALATLSAELPALEEDSWDLVFGAPRSVRAKEFQRLWGDRVGQYQILVKLDKRIRELKSVLSSPSTRGRWKLDQAARAAKKSFTDYVSKDTVYDEEGLILSHMQMPSTTDTVMEDSEIEEPPINDQNNSLSMEFYHHDDTANTESSLLTYVSRSPPNDRSYQYQSSPAPKAIIDLTQDSDKENDGDELVGDLRSRSSPQQPVSVTFGATFPNDIVLGSREEKESAGMKSGSKRRREDENGDEDGGDRDRGAQQLAMRMRDAGMAFPVRSRK